MVIRQSRKRLDKAIDKNGHPDWIVLLLSGADGSIAEQIHDFLKEESKNGNLEPWRKYYLITDLDVLEESERDAWFGGANTERYAVLQRETKKVVLTGSVLDLLISNVEPDILKIREAFTEGRGDDQ